MDACLQRTGLAGLPLWVMNQGDPRVRGGIASGLNCTPHHEYVGEPSLYDRVDGMGENTLTTQHAVEFVGVPYKSAARASGKKYGNRGSRQMLRRGHTAIYHYGVGSIYVTSTSHPF